MTDRLKQEYMSPYKNGTEERVAKPSPYIEAAREWLSQFHGSVHGLGEDLAALISLHVEAARKDENEACAQVAEAQDGYYLHQVYAQGVVQAIRQRLQEKG